MKTTLVPTIRHRPGLALRSKKYSLPQEEYGDLAQVAPLLPKDYGRFLNTDLMKIDPFYALHELFDFSASSKLQFLNLIDEKLNRDTSCATLAEETPSLSNLLYNRDLLREQVHRLKENIETIKCRGGSQFPHASIESELGKKANEANDALLRDFEYLLNKAEDLSHRCLSATGVIMNNANIEESKKAIVQAEKISKVTLLAFFYVPLSFTSSFFGMNFRQFGTSTSLGIWVWFAVSAPMLFLSFIFFKWDVPAFIKQSLRPGQMKLWFRRTT